MLAWRLLLGPLLIAGLVALFAADYRLRPTGLLTVGAAAVIAVMAAVEWLSLLAEREYRPLAWVVYGGNLLLVALSWLPTLWNSPAPLGDLGWIVLGMVAAVMAAWCGEMWRYQTPGHSVERAALAVFSVGYIGLPLALLTQLRMAGPEGAPGAWGTLAIASMLAVAKLGDIGAYAVGRLLGRHKMAPRLSPGKTLEGALGAILFGCAGAWLSRQLLVPLTLGTPTDGGIRFDWLGYGLAITIVGMVGDLAESLLKRDMNRKDSSRWLPGFGGVLDLVDSVLAVAPVAYFWWKLGLIEP